MTASTSTSTSTSTEQTAHRPEDFTTSEGLRALLNRLYEGGEDAWVHDPVARDLMEFAADKYRALARKHRLDTWEAVAAAFDAMQYRSTREANDPWAIITHAVRITCVYEERAQGLLCSVHQARRAHVSAFHDPERFSERDTALADYTPRSTPPTCVPVTSNRSRATVSGRRRRACPPGRRPRTQSRCCACSTGRPTPHGPRSSTSVER